MTEKTIFASHIKVRKRNGQLVNFNSGRIKNAIANAFKQIEGLPREVDISSHRISDVNKIADHVFFVLQERSVEKATLTVEEIQDEVIRQLYENGYKDVAELYANYRKDHAERRTLFERYSMIKRDGRVVSFKPEKITMAIAKALQADQQTVLTQDLIVKAKTITNEVVELIGRQWPDGRAIHIEEIQDLVEKALMEGGLHNVAKRYILYRQEHAKIREQKLPEIDVTLDWVKNVQYLDKDGKQHTVDLNALAHKLDVCCEGLENVSVQKILNESLRNFYNGIPEEQMSQANIMAARSYIETEPNYSFVTARLLLLHEYQEALGYGVNFEEISKEYAAYFPQYLKKAVDLELLNPQLLDFDLEFLAQHLVPGRDLLFRYLGLQTLYDRYFIHNGGRRIEIPQIFWMRVAMGLAQNEKAEDKNKWTVEFYHVLSTFRFVSSTPTLFNSGTLHPQLSSCYLTTVDDDLEHIFKCIQDDAMLSKWSGGLGNDWTNVRAMGSRIKKTNGKSQGVIPFLKVANDTALAVNQGGKRKGAMCAYLEVWHLDIEEFLELRKNTGDDRRRTHDMHTANWIPDLFMKRIKTNADWTLFSPSETPDLHHLYGQKFEKRYEEYEAMAKAGTIKQFKVLPAIQLWRKMLNMLFETGHPWITWKDPSNIRSPQDHVGVVHSSNLCTEILLNTSKEETAVCNLGSVNLAVHTTPDGLNTEKLKGTIRTAVRMLDNVIDINYYPTSEAQTSNLRHRPVGLGIMGFQDALYIQNMHYASQEAVAFADFSMEAISFYTIFSSSELSRERGSYSTFVGSKWDRGILPIDSLDLLEQERGGYLQIDRSARMDWTVVRESIKKNGMRNSLVMAIAPTATIANIVGVTSSIEPVFKNIFVKSNLSGEFTVVNEFLVYDLKKLNLWDQEMMDDLKYFDGSVQEIDRIPDHIKQKYATAFEIEYEWLIEAAGRRQKWIDMGQSLNLYQAKPSGQKVSDMYLLGWERGLKTTYYLRSMGATRIEKSTLDITKQKYVGNIVGRRDRDDSGKVTQETVAPVSVEPIAEPKEDCEACQ